MIIANARKAKSHTTLQQPDSTLGAKVHQLIRECPPLDGNSLYCNLLQCSHFADTSVAAFIDHRLVGFISAYIKPQQTDTLFIWQVAVHASARQQGLALAMLQHILARPSCQQIHYLETTITENNQASWRLFESLADRLQAPNHKQVLFDKEQHFQHQHDSEWLMRIGPFTAGLPQQEVF